MKIFTTTNYVMHVDSDERSILFNAISEYVRLIRSWDHEDPNKKQYLEKVELMLEDLRQ